MMFVQHHDSVARRWPALGILALLIVAGPAPAADLRATFTLEGNLNALEAGVPALINVDPLGLNGFETVIVQGVPRTVFVFNGNASPASQQAGLSLNTTGLIPANSYSIEMVFLFTEGNNAWRRILDVQGRTSDNGFYVDPSNVLDVFPTSGFGTTTFTNNVFHHVALTVDANVVRGYLDGNLEFTVNTDVMNIDNPGNLLNFFLDNDQGGFQTEYSDGRFALLRAWEGALTPAEVAALASGPLPTIIPEPASMTLLGLGVAGVIGYRWRRRAA